MSEKGILESFAIRDIIFQTSRLLKWRVDEYALQRTTIPLVMEVEVSYSPSHFGRFMLSVVWYKAHLFDLRLKMQIPTAEYCKEKYSHYVSKRLSFFRVNFL